jgi:16S rRNA (guanine966-N2)-methyltransferase
MRVIAGRWRGQPIRTLAGETTRPTADRVREAWASTVGSLLASGFEGARVLDAFAGSGALGLEALSRGGAHTVFCERDRRAFGVLRGNVAALEGAAALSTLLAADSFATRTQALLGQYAPYSLIVLDPPYACSAEEVAAFLRGLMAAGALAPQALVSYEHRAEGDDEALAARLVGQTHPVDRSPAGLQMVSCKTYGLTRIAYLRCP